MSSVNVLISLIFYLPLLPIRISSGTGLRTNVMLKCLSKGIITMTSAAGKMLQNHMPPVIGMDIENVTTSPTYPTGF